MTELLSFKSSLADQHSGAPHARQSPARSMKTMAVTPQMAKRWLDTKSKANCRHLPHKIKRYAADMRGGLWQADNGTTLSFDTNDKIHDGYHRLQAVVESGRTIEFDIISNVNPESFDTVDTGARRTPTHIMEEAGTAHPAMMAAGIRLMLMYMPTITTGSGSKPRRSGSFTNRDMLEFYRATKNLEETSAFVHTLGNQWVRFVGKGHMLALAMLASQNGHPLALIGQFANKLGSGANLSEGDAILLLRNRITETKASSSEQRQLEVLVKLIRAYNAWSKGRTLATLYGSRINRQPAYPDVEVHNPKKHRKATS